MYRTFQVLDLLAGRLSYAALDTTAERGLVGKCGKSSSIPTYSCSSEQRGPLLPAPLSFSQKIVPGTWRKTEDRLGTVHLLVLLKEALDSRGEYHRPSALVGKAEFSCFLQPMQIIRGVLPSGKLNLISTNGTFVFILAN